MTEPSTARDKIIIGNAICIDSKRGMTTDSLVVKMAKGSIKTDIENCIKSGKTASKLEITYYNIYNTTYIRIK